jgi:hypothetical protein
LPALDQTHRAYLRAVDEVRSRLRDVETELQALLDLEPLRARVQRLRCFRGIDDLTALTIAAELGDPRRFAPAPSTMAFVGLVPSEHRVARNAPRAVSPRPATLTCGESSSNPPGTIGITHLSAPRSGPASAAPPRTSLPGRGARSSASIVAINGSPHAANRNNISSPPSPVS